MANEARRRRAKLDRLLADQLGYRLDRFMLHVLERMGLRREPRSWKRSLKRCILIYIVKRTQIYLDDDQDRRLARRARASGRTKSALIREAIDRLLSKEPLASDLTSALDETFGAVPRISAPAREDWDRGYG